LVVFGGGLNGGILSRSLCYTSCVPEGKHVGQKDDTRENFCVTESKKKIEKDRKEEREREGGGKKEDA